MYKGITHTAFVVSDMEKSLRFYRDILGFEFAHELKRDGEPWLVYLKVRDGQFIGLFYGGSRRYVQNDKAAGFMQFCIEVAEIHQITDHLEKNGVTIDVRPKQGKDHNFQAWARDPDNNKIEFMQIDPSSPQANA